MHRADYDAHQAAIEGTWQNRQGRAEEWKPASKSDTRAYVMVVVALTLAGMGALASIFGGA